MEPEPRGPEGRATFLLVGLSILLTAAVIFILLVPVVQCRDCMARRIRMAYDEQLRYEANLPPSRVPVPPCERCRDRYKITLFNKWFGKPSPSY